MSTRSLVGGLTDGGTYVVYVHNDGYPESRLGVLEEIIRRDGPDKALVTLLSARAGGWSYLDFECGGGDDTRLDGRGRLVEGYGSAYTDAEEATPIRFPDEWETDSWIEWVYLIEQSGLIRYAAVERGVKPPAWDWKQHEVVARA